MKINFLFLFLLLNATSSFGQIRFEKGCLIDKDNHKIECLIKNYDWEKIPKEIEYKLNEKADIQTGNPTTIKEFEIFGSAKFISVNTKIDRSISELPDLSKLRNPIWKQEQFFVKVLLDGKASLYYYSENNNFNRFFYSLNDSTIHQLVYKEYFNEAHEILFNFDFRQQLWNEVRIADATISSVSGINYKHDELEKYFLKFNESTGNQVLAYEKKQVKAFFHLKVTPGINYSSMIITNSAGRIQKIEFDNKTNFRIGVETEFIMPFNKNKWGLIIEPVFQSFNSTKQTGSDVTKIKYSSLDVAVGIRHYSFLNGKTRIFFNSMINSNIGFDFKSTISFSNSSTILNINSGYNFVIGGGIDYKKISAEIRYYSRTQILTHYVYWSSDNHILSFIIGYRLF